MEHLTLHYLNARDVEALEMSAEEIIKAQEELKKEQETIYKCQGKEISTWQDCKGTYESETGH